MAKTSSEWEQAVANLCDVEREEALRHLVEIADETRAGIIRQLLGEEQKPLSQAQQHVYKKYIEPELIERCGRSGCTTFVPAGTNYCPMCEIEYG